MTLVLGSLGVAAPWCWAGPRCAYADDEEDGGSFYARWPYVKPADILPYLRTNATAGDVNSVLAAIDRFSGYYPMYRQAYTCMDENGAQYSMKDRLYIEQ
jgi:hypothetical protein